MSIVGITSRLAALPVPLLGVLGGVLGLVIGSYAATVLIRWPRGERANRGRSRCDGCARQLRWYELIPALSFVMANGKCRSCKQPVARRHLVLEVLFGLAGGVFFALGAPGVLPAVWLLILLAGFDGLHLWLPNRLVVLLTALALLTPRWAEGVSIADQVFGGIAGFAVLWIVALVFRRATGRNGMGGGDPKLFGAIGLLMGWRVLPYVMILACVLGMFDAAIRFGRSGKLRSVQLPFGAYLALATIGLVWWQISVQARPMPELTPSLTQAALHTQPAERLPLFARQSPADQAMSSD